MASKRSNSVTGSQSKKHKTDDEYLQNSYLRKTLIESGLILKHPPEKCIASEKTIIVIRNIKKNIQKHFDYPRNITDLYMNLKQECHNLDVFKQYLFPNIIRIVSDSSDEIILSDSVFKILLNVPILQNKLIDFIFEKAIDLASESNCSPWIQMILKCFSSLNNISDSEKMATNLINLLDVTTEKIVRLEIISAIPGIIGDQEHSNVATEMSRILSEDQDLIPAILDCLSYLCLSNEDYEKLQKKTLNILLSLSKCVHFPNFVKFLLQPSRISDTAYLEAVQGLRNALGWSTSIAKYQDIATSQVLTAVAIRNSMVSSKVIANAWLKVISACKVNTDHKAIDFIIFLILYSTSEEKQKQVEIIIKKQIKCNALKETLLDECFEKYKPILRDYLKHLICLTNSLLKVKADIVIATFASHLYTLMFSKLENSSRTVVAEILQLGLDSKHCVLNILLILNSVAAKDISLLKPQSVQMLTLLDRMDDMNLNEIRAIMNLLCGLAYSYENSVIRDDIHMVIRKELSSSSPKIKLQGILAGIHAVKYLMANSNDDYTPHLSDDNSFGSVSHLSEGDLREAAVIIELISQSTRQLPDMIAFFYDEFTKVIETASHINKQFLSWLTYAVTNDLQQNFIVESIEKEMIGELKLSLQYCLNTESEMDETIAINIAGLALQSKSEIDVGILSSLFQLVQILHCKQYEGDLSNIDALLGCAVIMPVVDLDVIEDLDNSSISNILDCLIHCVNWFRELLNAFAMQDDDALKTKILKRVLQIEELEILIEKIILKSTVTYKPPVCNFNVKKYTGEQIEKRPFRTQISKLKAQKVNAQDDALIPETVKTQGTQNNQNTVKSKLDSVHNVPLRHLGLNVLHLLKNDLSSNADSGESDMSIKTLKFVLKCVNNNIENILIAKIKSQAFLLKQDHSMMYDPKKAEDCAKLISDILPKTVDHLKNITFFLDDFIASHNNQDEHVFNLTSEVMDYITCLEYIFNMYTIYFKWIGFKSHHNALLKCSLQTIAFTDNTNLVSLKDLVSAAVKHLKKYEKYCLQLTTAVALIELLKSVQEYSENTVTLKILRGMAHNFLSQKWLTPDGIPEKGLFFNQSVDKFAALYFINNEIVELKALTIQLANDIKVLKSRNDTLSSLKTISKGNFAILYRNLGTAIHESTKSRLNKGLTNTDHLELWKDVAIILKHMSDIAKTLENRNNLSAFFKKSLPIIKLFLSQGIPILEIQLKNETEEVLEILKILQQSTRFLQSLCCHSRLKKDIVLMSKVPYMRQLLETLIYKVKAALVANKCSEAFWMGNLKNKNIHGEVIASQESIESEQSAENDDEDLLEEDESTNSDDEVLNPDSKSISDIV
ncbi:Fanconi anemia group D2 protein [Galleria mellonella]|uniref:Fanconi anemia group D2 protein n=1 Tax=Galleria mellonella TaxID=7137 RepID=A0A6J1X8U5_GALME|nr:Fanconi anemia group D2 protein [Galleria mellonella]